MTHYEDTVRSALSAEDAKLYDALGRSPNPVQAAFATLSSEHRLFAIGGWVMGFAMFAVAIYAASRFAEAETVRAMIGWAAGAIVALFALGFIKIWFFMEIQKDALLRELKRMELEIAALYMRRG
jgi:hypothetical protein